MAAQIDLYWELQSKKEAKGEKPGLGIGLLIFDEIKLIAKVQWNSKSHQFQGLALSIDECASLSDIFQDLKSSNAALPAQYGFQFLFRDLTSRHDIFGPYYFTSEAMKVGYLYGILWDVIRTFTAYRIRIIGLVMDGASSNLALAKQLCGSAKGPYKIGEKSSGDVLTRFEVPCSFENIYSPNNQRIL